MVHYGDHEGKVKHYILGKKSGDGSSSRHSLFPFGYKGENNQELVLYVFGMSSRCFSVDTT